MQAESFLSIRNLGKHFAPRRWRPAAEPVRWAVRDVNLELGRGRTLVLVGGSGAGKSTLARCLALLETPDSGEARLDGNPVRHSDVQLIPQQPAASFNPRFTAAEALSEPLVIENRWGRKARRELVAVAMERAGLSPDAAGKRVTEFSGGEQQRLAIARALTTRARLLILDESLSGLDEAAQEQILDLLGELQRQLGLSYVLISHDLGLAERVADEIAVMDNGRIVEHGPKAGILTAPRHGYTQALVDAWLALVGEVPAL